MNQVRLEPVPAFTIPENVFAGIVLLSGKVQEHHKISLPFLLQMSSHYSSANSNTRTRWKKPKKLDLVQRFVIANLTDVFAKIAGTNLSSLFVTMKKWAKKSRPLTVRLPGFQVEHEVGLGDVIKRATSAVGITPCAGCEKRAAWLNSMVMFSGRHRSQDGV